MPENSIEYRELHWADFPSYKQVMLQGMGEFERATGLDQTTDHFYKFFHRRTVWTLFSIMRALNRAPIRVFVGVDKGQVVGMASFSPLPSAGYVFGVATDSAFRGRGIATHLLELTHLAIQSKGKPWAALDVESDNETALRVYRKLGYQEKTRTGWHVGPIPATKPDPTAAVSEVAKSQMKEVAAWVSLNQPVGDHDLLTPIGRMFSRFETLTAVPGIPRPKTWKLSASGKTMAVVRGGYLPMIKTGFVLPAAWDPSVSSDSLLALMTPAIEWMRSLGATRTNVAVPDPSGPWGQAVASLGLTFAISTSLMVRPAKT